MSEHDTINTLAAELANYCKENGLKLVPAEQLQEMIHQLSDYRADMAVLIAFCRNLYENICNEDGKVDKSKMMGIATQLVSEIALPEVLKSKTKESELSKLFNIELILPVIAKYFEQEREKQSKTDE